MEGGYLKLVFLVQNVVPISSVFLVSVAPQASAAEHKRNHVVGDILVLQVECRVPPNQIIEDLVLEPFLRRRPSNTCSLHRRVRCAKRLCKRATEAVLEPESQGMNRAIRPTDPKGILMNGVVFFF